MPEPIAQDMLAEIVAIDAAARSAIGLPGRPQLQKVRYSHDAMIDLIISNPWIHQNQLAAYFGYSPSWVSTVMQTDMFQAKLALRREEVVDPVLKASLDERFRAVVSKSLEVLQEKLSQPTVPDNLALRAAELGAKALGLGGNAAPRGIVVDASDRLERLANRLTGLLSTKRQEVIDV